MLHLPFILSFLHVASADREVVSQGLGRSTHSVLPIWKQLYELSSDLSGHEGSLADKFLASFDRKERFAIDYQKDALQDVKEFVRLHKPDIEKALSGFTADGHPLAGIGASAYNDFYKWTMMPVMRRVHEKNDVVCTFSLSIRDVECRQLLMKAYEEQNELWHDILTALRLLANRRFDRDNFELIVNSQGLPAWDKDLMDTILGTKDKPRTLAQGVIATSTPPTQLPQSGHVLINLFKGMDNNLKAERIYIEATGPWPMVTWLETSMMQAVYEVLFRHQVREEVSHPDTNWYPAWLAQSLLRCARSAKAVEKAGISGALFSGRRTGGMPLLILEAMYLKYKLKEKFIGQSSVTAWAILRKNGINETLIPNPVGTHAHELSMVLSAVYSDKDEICPLSQAIGHILYWYLSVPAASNRARMAMLPDTLGTSLFLKTVKHLQVRDSATNATISFLDATGLARQDSGTLKAFKELLDEYSFHGKVMASEIETGDDLLEAQQFGYTFFGAGGFFGDNLKTWDHDRSLSMAAKVLRVYIRGNRSSVNPMKTGDAEGKLELDGLLSQQAAQAAHQRIHSMRMSCGVDKGHERILQNVLADVMKELDVQGHAAVQ